ncbi:MAG: DNA primase DnaG [Methanocorpusculum sp.]|nr:DNA primase DnaG [Methanocorpusculum sp.]MDE2523120.1 DNA primase DnaG [Methanocorpusculum sp.]MDE2525170.1 DNA primase DnaG [Methanocorpusculum sp.]
MYSPDTTKYLIHIHIETEGVVEKPDVVGAIFGQTEGLLGEDLDLRDLQRSGRVGRIDVQITSKYGKTSGELYIASSLDRAETAILAASLETIERVGPCVSMIKVQGIEDLRAIKRRQIVGRAKELLLESFDDVGISTNEILAEVRESIRVEKVSSIGEERLPAGPNVLDSDAIIIVEGRADVLNLLKCGIKNTVAVEGTKVPQIVADLSIKKNATVFVDGDRGGDLILRELLQVADIDYVAFSPRGRSVEDMSRKEIVKSLRNKIPADVLRAQLMRDGEIADLVQELEQEHADTTAETMPPAEITVPISVPVPLDEPAVPVSAVIPEEVPQISPEPVQVESLSPAKTVRTRKPAETPVPKQESNTEPPVHEVREGEVPLAAVATITGLVERTAIETPPVAAAEETQQPVLVAEPRTIAEHADWMRQTGRARVLTGEGTIYGDYSLSEMHDILPKLKGDFAGIIIDETINQQFVDTAAEIGMKFVVAKSFEGIVRRPVSIRMISL